MSVSAEQSQGLGRGREQIGAHDAPDRIVLTPEERLIALANPLGFQIVASRGKLVGAPHLAKISEALVAIHEGEIHRLIIQVPTRHGKTELISRHFAAWTLGLQPDQSVMVCGHGTEFATEHTAAARDLMLSWGQDLFDVQVDPDKQAGDFWKLRGYRGLMRAQGVGSGIIGKGGHKIIIDDPIASYEDAMSRTIRRKVITWYSGTLRTRLEPGAAIVIVMSRWTDDDLIGWCLDNENPKEEPWTVIDLPGLALDPEVDTGPRKQKTPDDPPVPYVDVLGRAPGEALWPARWPRESLLAMKHDMEAGGTVAFDAQIQCRPRPGTGAMFSKENFRYFEWKQEPSTGHLFILIEGRAIPFRPDPGHWLVFGTGDLALAAGDEGSNTAMGIWAWHHVMRWLLLLDCVAAHMSPAQKEKNLFRLCEKWHPTVFGIEQMPSTGEFIQYLRGQGFPVMPLLPRGQDKVARAMTASSMSEGAMLFLPTHAPWLHSFEQELIDFPKGTRNDQVDITAYAAREVGVLAKDLALHNFQANGVGAGPRRTITVGSDPLRWGNATR